MSHRKVQILTDDPGFTPPSSGAVVVVEASAPKVYPRVTLASASTLSGSVVRTLRGGE